MTTTPADTGQTGPAFQIQPSIPFTPVSPEAVADDPAPPEEWIAYSRSTVAVQMIPEAASFGHEEPIRFALVNGSDSTNTSPASGS